ncbi:MAG: PAS domain-containing protein, partial [Mycobacteriales bacterium]
MTGSADEELYALIRRLSEPYVVLDDELVVVDVTDAYATRMGCSRAELVGRTLLDAVPARPGEA